MTRAGGQSGTTGLLRASGLVAPPVDAPEGVVLRVLTGAVESIDIVVPRTTVKGRMRLLGRGEVASLIAEARRFLHGLGLPNDPRSLAAAGLLSEWNNEIAVRHLAVAVRDPADETRPLASLAEWRECDDNQIAAAWQEYQTLDEQLDPMREDLSKLSDAEYSQIEAAVKKKDATLLRSFGSPKLSRFLLTTVEPPAS